jgi:biotin transport system substrate-specific component
MPGYPNSSHQEISLSAASIPAPIDNRHFPLAAVVWPDRADGFSPVLRTVILVALGTTLLTLSPRSILRCPTCR